MRRSSALLGAALLGVILGVGGDVLARRLLATGPAASFAAPAAPEEEDMRVVAKLTRLSNVVVTEDTAFPYDTSVVLDTDYATWAGEGNPLVIVQTGWYWVHVNSTTLGTGYGGPSNLDWIHAVGRNGVTLADTVYSQRHIGASGASAQLLSGGSPVYLEAADELDVYYQNLVSGQTTLLVESNPSDGPDYTTDTGPGTLSPHLFLVKMSGPAP
jgi:hypothetical protein